MVPYKLVPYGNQSELAWLMMCFGFAWLSLEGNIIFKTIAFSSSHLRRTSSSSHSRVSFTLKEQAWRPANKDTTEQTMAASKTLSNPWQPWLELFSDMFTDNSCFGEAQSSICRRNWESPENNWFMETHIPDLAECDCFTLLPVFKCCLNIRGGMFVHHCSWRMGGSKKQSDKKKKMSPNVVLSWNYLLYEFDCWCSHKNVLHL